MLCKFANPAGNGDSDGKGGVLGHAAMVKYRFVESKQYLLQTSNRPGEHQGMLDANEIKRRFARALAMNPLPLKDIAEVCEVTPQAVGDWKRTGRIDKKHFQKLSGLMHTGLDYWLNDKPGAVADITEVASHSSVGIVDLLKDMAETQTAMARALAETIPTAGSALIDRLQEIDPKSERDYVATLKGFVRRELASQEAHAQKSSSRKVPGSRPRKLR